MPGAARAQWIVPVACGALALTAAVAVLVPTLRPVGWDLTALPLVAHNTAMAPAARRVDPGFHVVAAGDYDGQFTWGVAVDPIATGDVHQAFDKPSYRYGHPLLGWLGWALGAGQPRAAPGALLGAGLAALALAAAAASLLGQAFGRRGWEGLLVAVNPGLIYAAVHSLAEPLSAALLLGGLLAHVRGRRIAAAVCFGFLVLSKEAFVLVPLAIAAWELAARRTRVRDAIPLVACVLPAAGWWVYARLQLGAWFTTGQTALGAPFAGWRRSLLDAGAGPYSGGTDEATVAILAVLVVLLAFAGLLALRLRTPVDAVYVVLVIVVACLAPNATTILRDALRNVGVLLTLVPFVIASLPLRPTWTARRDGGSSTETRASPT